MAKSRSSRVLHGLTVIFWEGSRRKQLRQRKEKQIGGFRRGGFAQRRGTDGGGAETDIHSGDLVFNSYLWICAWKRKESSH